MPSSPPLPPCHPTRTCAAARTADGRVIVGGDATCCVPPVQGLGVVLVALPFGSGPIWPGQFVELPAGDYDRSPAARAVLVPEGWSVVVFPAPGFAGPSATLPAGAHNLSAPIGSLIVRGPWSWVDARHAQALATRAPGWATEAIAGELPIAQLVQLVLRDPARPVPPADPAAPVPDYLSTWRPGWSERLRGSTTPGGAADPAGQPPPSSVPPPAPAVRPLPSPSGAAAVAPAPAGPLPGALARAVGLGLCEPPPGWPYATAPAPTGADTSAGDLQRLVAASPAVQKSLRNAQASGVATGLVQASAKFVPVIGDIVKVAANLFEPLRQLFTREPCAEPGKTPCADTRAHADGRSFGTNGGPEGVCCAPALSGFGVLLTHHMLGSGAPSIKPGGVVPFIVDRGHRPGPASFEPRRSGARTVAGHDGRMSAGGAIEADSLYGRGLRDDARIVIPWLDAIGRPLVLPPGRYTYGQGVQMHLHAPRGVPISTRNTTIGELRARIASGEWPAHHISWPIAHRWPGWWHELAAGDYPDMSASSEGDPAAIDGRPAWSNLHWLALIPEGWSLTIYAEPGFAGDSLTLEAGGHDLWREWSRTRQDRPFRSARVRGWWTLRDSETVHHLTARTAGWLSADTEPVDREQAITLALQDPCRLPPPSSPAVPIPSAWPSFWRPGWRDRLQALTGVAPGAPAPVVAPSAPSVRVPEWLQREVIRR